MTSEAFWKGTASKKGKIHRKAFCIKKKRENGAVALRKLV